LNLAGKKRKGTELEVFSDRAARTNAAIFKVLAIESPQTIKQILKRIIKYEGLEETYYASLTKRLHCLQETDYIIKREQFGRKKQTAYDLQKKAYLAMFLKENSMQDIINQATDVQAGYILLSLLNVLLPEKETNSHQKIG
jgi:hypothetical protein